MHRGTGHWKSLDRSDVGLEFRSRGQQPQSQQHYNAKRTGLCYNTFFASFIPSIDSKDPQQRIPSTMRHRLARFALSNPAPASLQPSIQRAARHTRFQSTTLRSGEPATASLSPRWLSKLKTRIGKCIMFGLSTGQTNEACSILKELVVDWRELVAGSEGFLTGKNRRGLFRQEVVWGEMVPRPHSILPCNN